jgi:hypothetical protein
MDILTFGRAIQCLKKGHRVQRRGWNGKGMHIYLKDFSRSSGKYDPLVGETYLPVVVMFTAKGELQPGWLPSQADLLAEDWVMLD